MAIEKGYHGAPITWERARAIFNDPTPPTEVWERQFNYNDSELNQLASTPHEQINRNDLWYYYHDLAYVELQPELFAYLFPVCLMEWHDTLMHDESCSHGDSEFHYGMWKGEVFQKMLTPDRQKSTVEFFRDSFLQRLDAEPRAIEASISKHPFQWICRLNSLGYIVPQLSDIWEPWWAMESKGRAIAVLKYCSGLVYYEGENKLFGYPSDRGCYGPFLWKNDSYIHDQGWHKDNVQFIHDTVSFDYVAGKVAEAVDRLSDDSVHEMAQQLSTDLLTNRELVESRVSELPRLLSGERFSEINDGWTI